MGFFYVLCNVNGSLVLYKGCHSLTGLTDNCAASTKLNDAAVCKLRLSFRSTRSWKNRKFPSRAQPSVDVEYMRGPSDLIQSAANINTD